MDTQDNPGTQEEKTTQHQAEATQAEETRADVLTSDEQTVDEGPTQETEAEAPAHLPPIELPESGEIVATDGASLPTPMPKPPTPLQDSLRRLRRDKRAMISLGIILFFVLIAIIGPSIYQHIGGEYNSPINGKVSPDVYHSFSHQELNRLDEGPSSQYWLGTDRIGQDLLARLMQGLLISILVAVLVEVVNIILGILIGVIAGYYGGWVDTLLARFADLMFAFPGLLFVILLTGIFGAQANVTLSHIPILGPNGNARLILVAMALALTSWPLMARYVRGQTLQIKQQQFVEAARTTGSSDLSIILRHIIPNLFSVVIIASTLNLSNTIISEAGISLLGLGVQPPGSSIGLMISDGATLLSTHPWEALLPSGVLAAIVLAFSFLGDGLRDAFDPRSKD
ncbi:ABC transporter permease [Ktedonospora formicarum]|uniref:Peptide ABC transporter substrate-binding protein n=1 Tax=Ktedonospora formicarum TaxID=2778364 RepID=A0A8J3MQ99_9CHLR|nr:ABC transporter permease [Ktedonospora formicarum]GHO42403.1 peptide ABC transporter substrate-binding protein [Ktedonospora formicarum]